jgi:hypothetical protein
MEQGRGLSSPLLLLALSVALLAAAPAVMGRRLQGWGRSREGRCRRGMGPNALG